MSVSDTKDKLHNADSAAALLGIRPSTIRWYWTTGRLPRVKIGRLTRVREHDVLSLIECDTRMGTTRS